MQTWQWVGARADSRALRGLRDELVVRYSERYEGSARANIGTSVARLRALA